MFIIAFLLGLYSYLMPGGINLGVVSLIDRKEYRKLFVYILLVVLAEIVYSFSILYLFFNLQEIQEVKKIIEWVSVVLLFSMAIWSWFDKGNKKSQSSSKGIMKRAYLLMIIHPQQFIYWFIVGELITTHHWFDITLANIFQFILTYSVGVIGCLICYGYIGFKIIRFFSLKTKTINKIMAIIYVIICLSIIFTIV